jgi:uracil-DNA glycosylase
VSAETRGERRNSPGGAKYKGQDTEGDSVGQPNEIYDKYLTRAISEINDLTGEMLRCRLCSHSKSMPVIGSGHPLADIMLLKYRVQPSEVHEGVAFFGRAGTAIMKSCQRLSIDPLQLYGTNVLKCGSVRDEAKAEPRCLEYLRREIAIVEPKLIVAMGEKVVATLDRLALPTARALEYDVGEIVELTPGTEVLITPDIDASLDEQRLKAAFWRAFRRLGEWYEAIPPY